MTNVRHPATALRELSGCPSAAPRAGVLQLRGNPGLSEEMVLCDRVVRAWGAAGGCLCLQSRVSLRERGEETVLLLTRLFRDSTPRAGLGAWFTGLRELESWRFSVVSTFAPFHRKPEALFGVTSAKAHDAKPGRAT